MRCITVNTQTHYLITADKKNTINEDLSQAFQIAAEWRKGKDHFLADALSSVPVDRPGGRDQLGEMDQEGVNDDDVCEDLIAHESQWHALALPVLENNLMIRTSRCTLIADLELCNKLEREVM